MIELCFVREAQPHSFIVLSRCLPPCAVQLAMNLSPYSVMLPKRFSMNRNELRNHAFNFFRASSKISANCSNMTQHSAYAPRRRRQEIFRMQHTVLERQQHVSGSDNGRVCQCDPRNFSGPRSHWEAARRLRSSTLMCLERNTASSFWEGIWVKAL